ncbi:MAG: hypothetical protein DI626_07245, partial [Micavibrio aeruginosavorus]
DRHLARKLGMSFEEAQNCITKAYECLETSLPRHKQDHSYEENERTLRSELKKSNADSYTARRSNDYVFDL